MHYCCENYRNDALFWGWSEKSWNVQGNGPIEEVGGSNKGGFLLRGKVGGGGGDGGGDGGFWRGDWRRDPVLH